MCVIGHAFVSFFQPLQNNDFNLYEEEEKKDCTYIYSKTSLSGTLTKWDTSLSGTLLVGPEFSSIIL